MTRNQKQRSGIVAACKITERSLSNSLTSRVYMLSISYNRNNDNNPLNNKKNTVPLSLFMYGQVASGPDVA